MAVGTGRARPNGFINDTPRYTSHMSNKNEREQKIEEEEKARQHERERLEREEEERLK